MDLHRVTDVTKCPDTAVNFPEMFCCFAVEEGENAEFSVLFNTVEYCATVN